MLQLLAANTKNILYLAVFTALGLFLTYISGLFQLESRLLTMQIPVLLAGFTLSMNWAVACGMLIPVLGCVFLGTPELLPALPIIICEMVAYAASANMFYNIIGWKIIPSLLITMLIGRVVMFCAASILSQVMDSFNAFSYASEVITNGWPGLILQVIIIAVYQKIGPKPKKTNYYAR